MSTKKHNQEAKYGTWTYVYQKILCASESLLHPLGGKERSKELWDQYIGQWGCSIVLGIKDTQEAIMFCQFMALAFELDPIDWDTPVGRMMAALQEHLTPEQLMEWECNRDKGKEELALFSLDRAIIRAFLFTHTPQGHGYWWALHESFCSKHM